MTLSIVHCHTVTLSHYYTVTRQLTMLRRHAVTFVSAFRRVLSIQSRNTIKHILAAEIRFAFKSLIYQTGTLLGCIILFSMNTNTQKHNNENTKEALPGPAKLPPTSSPPNVHEKHSASVHTNNTLYTCVYVYAPAYCQQRASHARRTGARGEAASRWLEGLC